MVYKNTSLYCSCNLFCCNHFIYYDISFGCVILICLFMLKNLIYVLALLPNRDRQKQKPPKRVVYVFGGGMLALIEQKTNNNS